MKRWIGRAVTSVLAAYFFTTTSFAQNSQPSEEEIEAKRQWVGEVEGQNFHFWRRFFN